MKIEKGRSMDAIKGRKGKRKIKEGGRWMLRKKRRKIGKREEGKNCKREREKRNG